MVSVWLTANDGYTGIASRQTATEAWIICLGEKSGLMNNTLVTLTVICINANTNDYHMQCGSSAEAELPWLRCGLEGIS